MNALIFQIFEVLIDVDALEPVGDVRRSIFGLAILKNSFSLAQL